MGWHRWVGSQGYIQGLDRYGASAPGNVLFANLGFVVEQIEQIAMDLLK
jgi:transketolase